MEMSQKITNRMISEFISKNSNAMESFAVTAKAGGKQLIKADSQDGQNSDSIGKLNKTSTTQMNPPSDKSPICTEEKDDPVGNGDEKMINREEMIEGKKNGENGKIITRTGPKAMNPYRSRAHTTNETPDKSVSGRQPTAADNFEGLDIPKRKIVTFGLHKGWTSIYINGSIYLANPCFGGKGISLTDALQRCNEIYDTSTIVTGEVYMHLSDCVRTSLRLIDCAIVQKGGRVHQLYSVDCFPENQKPFET
jgi:hypothetical protein